MTHTAGMELPQNTAPCPAELLLPQLLFTPTHRDLEFGAAGMKSECRTAPPSPGPSPQPSLLRICVR